MLLGIYLCLPQSIRQYPIPTQISVSSTDRDTMPVLLVYFSTEEARCVMTTLIKMLPTRFALFWDMIRVAQNGTQVIGGVHSPNTAYHWMTWRAGAMIGLPAPTEKIPIVYTMRMFSSFAKINRKVLHESSSIVPMTQQFLFKPLGATVPSIVREKLQTRSLLPESERIGNRITHWKCHYYTNDVWQ